MRKTAWDTTKKHRPNKDVWRLVLSERKFRGYKPLFDFLSGRKNSEIKRKKALRGCNFML